MRLPVPTGREVRATIYVLALCALAITVTLCWAIVHKVNQSDEIVHIASSSADTVKRLNDKVDAQAVAAEAAQEQASAERAALRRTVARQTAENRRMRRLVDAMAELLRANGLSVPDAALTPQPPPKQQTPSGASPKPKPRTPSPRPTPTPPAAPSPTPDDPGLICNLAPLLCP